MITGDSLRCQVLGPCLHCGRGLCWGVCDMCLDPPPARCHPPQRPASHAGKRSRPKVLVSA